MSASLNCGSFDRHVGTLLSRAPKTVLKGFSKCKKMLTFYRAVTLTSLCLVYAFNRREFNKQEVFFVCFLARIG